ncbi:MAG TPA: RNA polymerase sigma factor [Bacteroidales bacterium]|nr:RNA polymerase sigma factor [Bacteroidales bacterium]
MTNLLEIIAGCRRMEKRAQKSLYDIYAPMLMGVAMRYGRNRHDAEDILQDAFVRIFTNIQSYVEIGSFEGWMRTIVINTALSFYRRNNKHLFHKDYDELAELKEDENASADMRSDFTRDELLWAINSLPDGYRLVFNLHAIEGLKHKEISEMMGIDPGTSKSQYYRARMFLQEKLIALSSEKKAAIYE